ncbi:hypothetical protein PTKIN_Ptkin01aG0275700 [Pterospermum kingtungense]
MNPSNTPDIPTLRSISFDHRLHHQFNGILILESCCRLRDFLNLHGCLWALDGTYIQVNVLASDRSRFRTRKNEIATNVLGVCTPDMSMIVVDPIEQEAVDISFSSPPTDEIEEDDLIQTCETSNAWTEWRDKLTKEMFNS